MIVVRLKVLKEAITKLETANVMHIGMYRKKAKPDTIVLECADHSRPRLEIKGELKQ